MAKRILTGKLVTVGTLVLIAVILAYAIVSKPPGGRKSRKVTLVPEHFDPMFFWLSPEEVSRLPIATRFDLPMGGEGGALVYNAQRFRENGHLGDDFNGIGGTDSDLGDPVFAVADGTVVYSGTPTPGWGNVVVVAHRVPKKNQGEEGSGRQQFHVIQSFYAHLDDVQVVTGIGVRRGEQIAVVGPPAAGSTAPHLHFELRQSKVVAPGVGYANRRMDRLNPTKFLDDNRGAPSDLLNPPPMGNDDLIIKPAAPDPDDALDSP